MTPAVIAPAAMLSGNGSERIAFTTASTALMPVVMIELPCSTPARAVSEAAMAVSLVTLAAVCAPIRPIFTAAFLMAIASSKARNTFSAASIAL